MRQTMRTAVAATVMVTAVLMVARETAAEPRGTQVTSPAPVTRRVVVSLPDRKLALIVDGSVVRVFPVAVGAPSSPTPVGRFTIINRLSEPTYYRPGTVIGPGPRNPLGTRWIGIDRKGYGIHGTDEPGSIGSARSHGCIRLRNRDVEQLFPLLRVGDVVELVAERTPETARLFGAMASSAPSTATASDARTIASEPSTTFSKE